MKRLFISLIILSLSSIAVRAQTVSDSLVLWNFYVYDGFTEKQLNARVSVFEADSVTALVDSIDYVSPYYVRVPRRPAYVLKVSSPGYAPQTLRVDVPEKRRGKPTIKWEVPSFYLWHAMQYDLGEASVQGSKILMVMRGDTLVYNASAFNLAEGSMLDNLVRALPGVKLEDGGRITVNGEFVSSLLVNGRDFFKGDPQIALANLPAYTVDKVKVYRKAREGRDRYPRTEAEKRKDPLVMDVNLKREYAQGWIANVEAGGGSRLGAGFDPVWMGRLFALRYTNHSSLGIYGTINNMDDYDRPGSKGEWKRTEPGQGRRVTKMGGVDFSIDGKKTGATFQTDLQAMRQTIDNEARTTSEDFLPSGGSLYRQDQSASRQGLTDVKWKAKAEIPYTVMHEKKPLYVNASAYYTRTTDDGTGHSWQWDTIPQGAGPGGAYQPWTETAARLYDRTVQTNSVSKARGATFRIETFVGIHRFKNLHFFDVGFEGAYNRRDRSSLTADRITYAAATPGVAENRRSVQPEMDYTFRAYTSYQDVLLFGGKLGKFTLHYSYKQEFQSGHRDLDTCSLDGGADGLQPPSATDPAQWMADERNSFHTTRLTRSHQFEPLLWHIPLGPLGLHVGTYLTLTQRRIHDFRGGNDRELTRHDFRWEPWATLSFYSEDMQKNASLGYEMQQGLPDIFSLLDVRDDSDPLVISEGNSQLKLSRTHTVTARFDYKEKAHQRLASVVASYRKADRQVATARWYDLTTGVTRLRPENIDGNWDASLRLHYNQALGRYDRWTIEGDATGRFLHSVDFASDNLDAPLPDRVAVDNLSLDASLRTDYRFKQWHAGAKMEVKHTRLDSRDAGFTPMDYTDFSAGVTLTAPLFWGIDLETDVMAYLRRGYTDASMNTTDWVWNASLSKALGRRKQWLVRAVGFDLLQQLSRVTRTVNSQGRTETWYNTVPAYASLHLTYRFDMKPKKKAGARE